MAAKEQVPLPPGADAAPPPRKRSRFKFFMLLGSLLLVLGTAGGASYWLFFREVNFSDIMSMITGSATQSENPAAATGGKQPGGQTAADAPRENSPAGGSGSSASGGNKAVPRPVPLPDLTVNLADPGGNRYLKIGMEVEFTAAEAVQELAAQNARVRDAIILLLSGKTVAELSTPEGKVLLKNEVAARLNQILGAPRVARVFFTNFVFQ